MKKKIKKSTSFRHASFSSYVKSMLHNLPGPIAYFHVNDIKRTDPNKSDIHH